MALTPISSISESLLVDNRRKKMSIYILADYLKACEVLGVEPTAEGLKKWKKYIWKD